MNGLQAITKALTALNVIQQGETPDNDTVVNALDYLNDWLDAQALQDVKMYAILSQQFPLVSGVSVYSIGPGGTFNTDRPINIDRGSVLINASSTNALERPMTGPVSSQRWQGVPVKNTIGGFPTVFKYDKTVPLGAITVWPVPQQGDLAAIFYLWQQLEQFTDLVTDVVFPKGYARYVRYSLALDLAPNYNVDPQRLSVVADIAEKASSDIMRANRELVEMTCDEALVSKGSHFNWYTGEMR